MPKPAGGGCPWRLLSSDLTSPVALRRGPSNEMLVEVRPAVPPPGEAFLSYRDFIQIEFLYQKLRVVDTCCGHHGRANGIDDHALADVPAAVLVAGAVDGDDEDTVLIGAAP